MRFAAIATEIGTGHEIWITRGRLADALRASYALPGIFPPVRLGERWLVDGALVNPVPVSVARALGARLVIAVNVNTDMFGRGTTIPDQGATEPEPPIEEEVASRGLFGLFGAEKTAKRRHLRHREPARAFDRHGRGVQHHAGSHHARAARGRSARHLISPRVGASGCSTSTARRKRSTLGTEAAERALEGLDEVVAALA